MASFRFVLILVLTVALDLSSPVPQVGAVEAIEEFEEVVHVRGGRRPFRLVRDTVAPAVARQSAADRVHRPRVADLAARRLARTTPPIRKRPPPVTDSSATPEDH